MELTKIRKVLAKLQKEESKGKSGAELRKVIKEYNKHLAAVEEMERVDFIPDRLEMSIDWTASRTWGSNPCARLWAIGCGYHESRSVGGCGYDKRSTAAAEALEQNINIKALAFALLNSYNLAFIYKVLKSYTDTREVFGYGLHFGRVYCNFGAGCGMSSVVNELEHLGYKCEAQHEPQRGSDYYLFILNKKSKGGRIAKKIKGGE